LHRNTIVTNESMYCSTYHHHAASILQNRRSFHSNRGILCSSNSNWRRYLLDFSWYKLSVKKENWHITK